MKENKIPKGYEIAPKDSGYAGQLTIEGVKLDPIQGTFNWYIKEYMNTGAFDNKDGHFIYPEYVYALNKSIFDEVPFEFKIGLLRFICIRLNISFVYSMRIVENMHINLERTMMKERMVYKPLEDLCPNSFLMSILNKEDLSYPHSLFNK